MVVNTYPEIEELAKQTVLYAMKHIESKDCFFEPQGRDSIFFKVYDDLWRQNTVAGSYFLVHLKNKYDVKIDLNLERTV